MKKKKAVLDKCAPSQNQSPTIPISLAVFVRLLKKLASKPEYNGIRVYFACYPDRPVKGGLVPPKQGGQLTLLFVPTRPVAGWVTGVDDPDQYYYLYEDQLHHLPTPGTVDIDKDHVTSWISHYRNDRVNALQADGGNGFTETCSLWYSMVSIKGGPGENGLIKFIACMKAYKPNPVIGLSVQLAAFTHDDPPKFPFYQLSLIFDLVQEHDTKGSNLLAFGSGSLPLRDNPADTGIPCPPATNCPGSGFAASVTIQK
jgi:hypothetical protein